MEGGGEVFRQGGGEVFRQGGGEVFRQGGGEVFTQGGGEVFRQCPLMPGSTRGRSGWELLYERMWDSRGKRSSGNMQDRYSVNRRVQSEIEPGR